MWYSKDDDCGIVISSRVRLARNLKDFPFSTKMNKEQAADLNDRVFEFFKKDTRIEEARNYKYKNISVMNDKHKLALLESHIISPDLVNSAAATGVILRNDDAVSVMVNEEDHFRIQAICRGRCINKAYEAAVQTDTLLGKHFPYAYNDKYGFLTTCPTNLGTGMRASYMIHIPFLEAGKFIKPLSNELSVYGFTIRGIFGEGSNSKGSFYQISNQRTLGQSEEEILTSLDNICEQIINQEKELRKQSLERDYIGFSDRVYRAYGTLRYARKISSASALECLSVVRTGLCEGILKTKDKHNIHKLMIEIQPANLMLMAEKNLESQERDRFRAEYIRSKLFALDE